VWPEGLAGRRLRAEADAYVLYAVDADLSKRLGGWLDRELASFCSRYVLPTGRGLVLAIEPGSEPLPELEEWRSRNIDRRRTIHWATERRSQALSTQYGRPYSFSRQPYFRESFSLPREDALRVGVRDTFTPKPAWICVLTTDAHLTDAFNEMIREHEREVSEKSAQEPERMPPDQVLCSWLFWLMYKTSVPVYRSIDIELMHLQRREALWDALIRCSSMNAKECKAALSHLQDDTDEAWKQLYFSRPIE
jgi:hypothetical protein